MITKALAYSLALSGLGPVPSTQDLGGRLNLSPGETEGHQAPSYNVDYSFNRIRKKRAILNAVRDCFQKGNTEAQAQCIGEFVREDPCVKNGPQDENCAQSFFEPGEPTFVRRDTGQTSEHRRILVVDQFLPSPFYVRYQNHLDGYYEFTTTENQDIKIDRKGYKVMLPVRLGAILEVYSDLSKGSSATLAPILPPLREAYGDMLSVPTSHGNAVTSILMDMVPDNQVVLLDSLGMDLIGRFPDLFCDLEDDENFEKLKNIGEQYAKALDSFIDDRNIRYINASFGVTAHTLATGWNRQCGGHANGLIIDRAFEIYLPIYRQIFGNSQVIAAQAANERPVNAWHDRFDVKRDDFSSRLRIGSLGHTEEPDIPDVGQGFAPIGSERSPTNDNWVDTYFNAGCVWGRCRDEKSLSMTHFLGFGRGPLPAPATSFVTPVGLAEIVYWDTWLSQKQHSEDGENRKTILKDLSRLPFRDPLLHHLSL